MSVSPAPKENGGASQSYLVSAAGVLMMIVGGYLATQSGDRGRVDQLAVAVAGLQTQQAFIMREIDECRAERRDNERREQGGGR